MPDDFNAKRGYNANSDGGLELQKGFAKWLSNLAGVLRLNCASRYGGYSLSCREDGRWFAVARALEEEGRPVVAFGSGSSPWDALRQLNGSIASGKWKLDGFAREKGLGPPMGVEMNIAEGKGERLPLIRLRR